MALGIGPFRRGQGRTLERQPPCQIPHAAQAIRKLGAAAHDRRVVVVMLGFEHDQRALEQDAGQGRFETGALALGVCAADREIMASVPAT